MNNQPVQLQSWGELVAWLEREAAKIGGPLASRPASPPVKSRMGRKGPPQTESLFDGEGG